LPVTQADECLYLIELGVPPRAFVIRSSARLL
jgi:hypothetical protein